MCLRIGYYTNSCVHCYGYIIRQNVVFEHGYLIGKLGRNNVCALVKGDIELPNDISGIVYIQLDSNGSWKIPLAKELKLCI